MQNYTVNQKKRHILIFSVTKHYNLVPAKGGDLFGW